MKYTFLRWMIPLALLAAFVILTSCSEDRSPLNYQTHPKGWEDPANAAFHGRTAMIDSGNACKSCHGQNLDGASAGSCYDCHAVMHYSVTNDDLETHIAFLSAANYSLARCAGCHGTDYAGGWTGASCKTCHTGADGPATCGGCHALPPVDDDGLPYGMNSGAFGAHASHARFGCTECHPSVNGIVHADALPAEVSFANARFADLHSFNPVFTHIGNARSGNGGCASVYCHSDGRGGAPVALPQWVGGVLECGGCHRMPPPAPHPDERECHECHTHVDPVSDYEHYHSIRFLVDSLHVNGVVNF